MHLLDNNPKQEGDVWLTGWMEGRCDSIWWMPITWSGRSSHVVTASPQSMSIPDSNPSLPLSLYLATACASCAKPKLAIRHVLSFRSDTTTAASRTTIIKPVVFKPWPAGSIACRGIWIVAAGAGPTPSRTRIVRLNTLFPGGLLVRQHNNFRACGPTPAIRVLNGPSGFLPALKEV